MVNGPWPHARITGDTFRLIPSHFPPIALFENLLDPSELDAAYALESLTNDRLRDQAGDIALVPTEDRVSGPGTTPIMAAFTHTGFESRFTRGQYGVYYAARDIETALCESKFSRARLLSATNEGAQTITMRCYSCEVNADFWDVRDNESAHHPNSFEAAQSIGQQARDAGAYGVFYRSVRRPGGECIAALRPKAMVPPAKQTSHYQFYWDGNTIAHTLAVSEVL